MPCIIQITFKICTIAKLSGNEILGSHLVFTIQIQDSQNVKYLNIPKIKIQYPSEYQTLEYQQIHLNTGENGCPLFKRLSHVTWRTI